MVIWLRNTRSSVEGLGVGIEGDVLRHEHFAKAVDINDGFAEMQRQCDEAREAARADAEAMLEGARAQASELIALAENDYASAGRRGYEEGFQRGLTDWHARASQAHTDACALEAKAHNRLAELVTLAVEQVVASADPKALFLRASATVERIVADGSPVHLRVHPSDVTAASEAFQSVTSAWRDAGRSVRLQVSADATLLPGACVAETDLGAVDASLSLHLAGMRGAIARAVQDLSRAGSAEMACVEESACSGEAGNAIWMNEQDVLDALPHEADWGEGSNGGNANTQADVSAAVDSADFDAVPT
jgi:type III secretion protein L